PEKELFGSAAKAAAKVTRGAQTEFRGLVFQVMVLRVLEEGKDDDLAALEVGAEHGRGHTGPTVTLVGRQRLFLRGRRDRQGGDVEAAYQREGDGKWMLATHVASLRDRRKSVLTAGKNSEGYLAKEPTSRMPCDASRVPALCAA